MGDVNSTAITKMMKHIIAALVILPLTKNVHHFPENELSISFPLNNVNVRFLICGEFWNGESMIRIYCILFLIVDSIFSVYRLLHVEIKQIMIGRFQTLLRESVKFSNFEKLF